MTNNERLTGTMTSELIGNKRLWTLIVSVMPRLGQLIAWTEPACGFIPAQALCGWLSSEESTEPGYVLLIVPGESRRWVRVSVVQLDEIKVLPAGARVIHLGYLATVITGNAPDDFAEVSTVVNIKYDIPPRGHSIQKDVPASECLLAVEDSFEGDGPSVPILTESGDYDPYGISDGTQRPSPGYDPADYAYTPDGMSSMT